MRLPVNLTAPIAASVLLLLSGHAHGRPVVDTPPLPSGPAADYPVVVGEPYTIGSTTWTPSDQLNYDAVGYSGIVSDVVGIAAAHKTLPVPSYAEVTALDTGHTILVRIVARGPQDNDTLIALSPEARTQLGLAAGTRAPVRVRRVNPPEIERAALRGGAAAPIRMDTPESLLKVLRRKLAEQSPLMPPPSVPPAMPKSAPVEADRAQVAPATTLPLSGRVPEVAKAPVKAAAQKPVAAPSARPTPGTSTRSPQALKGGQAVQVAAFSTKDRADAVARQLGGSVTAAGSFWRVRLGPFASKAQAASALEKAKTAGYRDARIQRAD